MLEDNCYKCKHRGEVPGSVHSSCRHPMLTTSLSLMILGGFAELKTKGGLPMIVGNEHGRKSGWFNWPLDFDPTWLEVCHLFEANDSPVSGSVGDAVSG